MFSTRQGYGRRGRSAFTLIEVLVVVAIIALLVAILLPSLSKARQQAQRAVCASQLSQFSKATWMYYMPHNDSLPGPIHPSMELETYQKTASGDYEEWHLPYFIRRYFTDKSKTGEGTDEVAKCPTALRISTKKLKNEYGRTDWKRPFSYALNNWNRLASSQVNYGTDPPWYFGWPNDFWVNDLPPFRPLATQDPDAMPKKIQVIRQPAREWAYGDAFIYTRVPANIPGLAPGQWKKGTYQFDFAQEFLPDKPFHNNGINVAMFDGHIEWQRPWRGAINHQP